MLNAHMFLGMLLLGPVALKMGSTGYRFVRYYTGADAYRRKGPPAIELRLLAPFVVVLDGRRVRHRRRAAARRARRTAASSDRCTRSPSSPGSP